MRASMRGGAEEEVPEEEEQAEGEEAGSGANDTGGSNDAGDVTVDWPRAPEAEQGDPPEDLENAETWGFARDDPEQPPPPQDEADEALVNGITQLEELIERLERRACGCPLNGQAPLPQNGMRNGRGTPHRALKVRVTVPRQGQEDHTQDYYIPLAPELVDTPGMLLSGRVYVNRPQGDTPTRTVRIELSGPEQQLDPDDSNVSIGSARTTIPDFMNWIEFRVDHELQADDVDIEAWQEDMPAVPFILHSSSEQRLPDTRGGGGGGGGGGGRRRPDDHNDDDDDDGGGDNRGNQGGQGDDDKGVQPPREVQPHGGISTTASGPRTPAHGGDTTREALDDTIARSLQYVQNQGNQTGDPPGRSTANDRSTAIEEVDLSDLVKESQKKGNSSGTKTQNDSGIEEIIIDVGKTPGALTTITHGVVDPTQPRGNVGTGTDDSSWLGYELSLMGDTAATSGSQKRTAEAAGIDDGGGGGQGGDASRPRVEGHNTPRGAPPSDDPPPDDSLSSPNFKALGLTDMSTPKEKAERKRERELIRSTRKMNLDDSKSSMGHAGFDM
ncbi:hypothetical protein FJTKL_13578 [Diaporthe vaccinii]|uniref:Uncharacterized protein n=1 Tax=Diaporthe vaccinii TaxID=105482 RepID=A0ABR4E9S5_9PEZI